jgi:hypothetical protein
VSEAKSEETRGNALRRQAHLLVYALAIGAGLVLGARGVFGSGRVTGPASSTALARVGYALRADGVVASAEAWRALRADLDVVRAGMKPEDQRVFDLIVAVRGLRNGGRPELGPAERLCSELGWPRCERSALAELASRSRP